MEIITLASSSSGNCALVTTGGAHILIDAGISFKRVRESLAALGVEPREIAAVLITHTHSDHIGGLPVMSKYMHTRVVASGGVGAELEATVHPNSEIMRVQPGAETEIAAFSIRAFRTMHDSVGSVGYRITDGKRTLVFATDLGVVTPEVTENAIGADVAVIEANHDLAMLKHGPYPPFLKRRIASDHGHLSNEMCGVFAVTLAQSGTKTLILAHLSKENNTPPLAQTTVERALKRAGAADVTLAVAPHDGMGQAYIA